MVSSLTLPPSMKFTHLWPIRDKVEHLERQRAKTSQSNLNNSSAWPAQYTNSARGKVYQPHNLEEADFVSTDGPRYFLCKGGEGSGKSTAGIIKTLERLRRGMSGIMGSSDLQHFKISLWKEFRRWCPREVVIPSQHYRLNNEWEPSEKFTLNFVNGTELICGGFKESELGNWEGPNVNFVYFDEAWKHETPKALKLFAGRIRIPGANGEPPQLWITSIPWMNWMHDYFGPVKEDGQDEQARFKSSAKTITLKTSDNQSNLDENYIEERSSVLTEAEIRVRMDAEWEDIDTTDRFLTSMTWWDSCVDAELGAFNPRQGMVLGVDGAKHSDYFAVVGVTRHPSRREDVAVRFSRVWKPVPGNPISLSEVAKELAELRSVYGWRIIQVAYDPYQLELMMEDLGKVFWTEPFTQFSDREMADKFLLDVITSGKLAHDGTHTDLREHLNNADRKLTGPETNKLRIVKRSESKKIDLAVALSMATYRCLKELNL